MTSQMMRSGLQALELHQPVEPVAGDGHGEAVRGQLLLEQDLHRRLVLEDEDVLAVTDAHLLLQRPRFLDEEVGDVVDDAVDQLAGVAHEAMPALGVTLGRPCPGTWGSGRSRADRDESACESC